MKKVHYSLSLVLCVVCALMVSGCGRHTFVLQPVTKKRAHYTQEKDGVEVLARSLSRHELSAITHRPYAQLNGVNCVALTVCNHTRRVVTLDRSLVKVPLVAPKQVDQLLGCAHERMGYELALFGHAWMPLVVGEIGMLVANPCGAAFLCFWSVAAWASIPFLIIDEIYKRDSLSYFVDSAVLTRKKLFPGNTRSVLLFVDKMPATFDLNVLVRGRGAMPFTVHLAHSVGAPRVA